MSRELDFDEVNAVAQRAARAAASKVSGSSYEDLAQECWVWIMKNYDRILDIYAEDEDGGYGRVYKSLYHWCLNAAQQDKAQREGYRTQDLYYYSLAMLRNLLPWWFEEGQSDPPHVIPDRDIKVDIDIGWRKIREEDRRLLTRAFKGDPDLGQFYQELAVEYDCSDDSARKRVERSIRRLQEALGGPRPRTEPMRKVVSNAAARAAASNQYDD